MATLDAVVIRSAAALCAIALSGSPVLAAPRLRLPPRPSTASLLSAQPIMTNGTLIRDGERLRTLELDELAPLRLRLSIPF